MLFGIHTSSAAERACINRDNLRFVGVKQLCLMDG
jgi:hypothetical protein